MTGEKQRRHTAVHEAGHAVACIALCCEFTSVEVYDQPRGGSLGRINWPQPHNNPIDAAIIDLAGPYAEARYRRVSRLSVYLSYGSDDWDRAERRLDRNSDMLQWAEKGAGVLIRDNWPSILAVASALVERGSLTFGHAQALAGEVAVGEVASRRGRLPGVP